MPSPGSSPASWPGGRLLLTRCARDGCGPTWADLEPTGASRSAPGPLSSARCCRSTRPADSIGTGSGFIIVPVNNFLEERLCVGGRCCGEADLDGVKIFQHFAPFALIEGCVASMALVGYDTIERIDWDIQLPGFGILVDISA